MGSLLGWDNALAFYEAFRVLEQSPVFQPTGNRLDSCAHSFGVSGIVQRGFYCFQTAKVHTCFNYLLHAQVYLQFRRFAFELLSGSIFMSGIVLCRSQGIIRDFSSYQTLLDETFR